MEWKRYKNILTDNNRKFIYFLHVLCHELQHAVQKEEKLIEKIIGQYSRSIYPTPYVVTRIRETDAEVEAYENCNKLYKFYIRKRILK